ncbi:hypothetical protein [Gracilibacillus timonensis]|uniref:hypothetical protein n=1 Tax=Gracilibacillus timonensis TaxID=1816696 RepID=UPI00082549BD|nr:hypothetical protein [Gracilibacillus timonensis]
MRESHRGSTFRLMDISKLSDISLFFAVFIFVIPLILFFSHSFLTWTFTVVLLSIALFINICLLVQAFLHKRDNPALHIAFLCFLLICYLVTFISFSFDNQDMVMTLQSFAIFAWFFACSSVLLQLMNILFIWTLKRVFPQHLPAKQEIQLPSLAKLSAYIDLPTQKMYHSLCLLEYFLSAVFLIFFAFFLQKISGLFGTFLHPVVLNWIQENSSFFAFFNLLSLLALIVTIQTLTYRQKHRITATAFQRMKEDFDGRI